MKVTNYLNGMCIDGVPQRTPLSGVEIVIRIPRGLLYLHPWCDIIPYGYGYAWGEPCSESIIIAPLGLNWLFGWFRAAYYGLMRGPRIQTRIEAAYFRGFKDGQRCL